jgi:hypothetical protein
MKVRCRKGVATHLGPESCGGIREDVFEALIGETAGQPLSREIGSLERRRCYPERKATPWAAHIASRARAPRGRRP